LDNDNYWEAVLKLVRSNLSLGSGVEESKSYLKQQLVRYEGGGHPLILARIVGLGFVPREIRVEALQPEGFDRGPWIVRPTCFRRSQAAPPCTDGLREVAGLDGTEPADALLAISRPAPLATGDEDLAPRLGAAIAAIRSGDALGGTLAFLELTLEISQINATLQQQL
jgi:hypothetical protein